MDRKERIFVIGSDGQLALSLLEAASARNITLEAFGPPSVDLTNPSSLEAPIRNFKPTVIVNAAAYTAVDAAEDNEDLARSINATGPEVAAQIADELDIPFIQVSTDYVFDGTKKDAYVEDDPTGPQGAYGRTKLEGEDLVLSAANKAIVLRTSWVYSPFGKNFLKTMLMLAKTRDELGVVADQVGNPTYAPDIAEAILAIVEQIAQTGWRDEFRGVFHLAGTGTASWHEFAEAIFEAGTAHGLKRPHVKALTTADYPTPAKRPANSRLDCSKLAETFGVHLPSWEQSMVMCVNRLSEAGELG
ncbi:dTDP-4-dehydrorhamnose reductase [Kordiimonas lipolytica]|uniref:dTDP-4-dehydrorhamnose reductase n=1 Tax=Kordiimonas lipolytica TaxID=1662421 RepID=A0ABV8U9C4_9PROT|nr:dTDP-4-dehydrorhamnose reductase [Kordiimonas lipolytica]